MKKLELGNILIHDVQFSNEGSKVENGVLYVNKEEICKIALEDENIASCEVFLARPGESVRITPVKDVIEPRVKVEGKGGIFPGWIAKVDTVGEGRTHVLKGAAVVTTGKDRRLPGRYHRYDRSWRRLHPILQDHERCC